MTQDIADLLRAARLVAVLTIEAVEHAVPLARALVAGGVRTLEITLRTAAGAGAARAVREAVPDAVVGLGTVLTRRDLELTRDLGLPFAFSPGATPELLDAAVALGVPFVPGIATASELIAALARGFTTVNAFPRPTAPADSARHSARRASRRRAARSRGAPARRRRARCRGRGDARELRRSSGVD